MGTDKGVEFISQFNLKIFSLSKNGRYININPVH